MTTLEKISLQAQCMQLRHERDFYAERLCVLLAEVTRLRTEVAELRTDSFAAEPELAAEPVAC